MRKTYYFRSKSKPFHYLPFDFLLTVFVGITVLPSIITTFNILSPRTIESTTCISDSFTFPKTV